MGAGKSDKDKLTIRLEKRQIELLEALDPLYGANVAEKVREAVRIFLHEHSGQMKR